MIALRLPAATPICNHACLVHTPATVGSVARDTFARVSSSAQRATAPLAAALTPPLMGGITPLQAIGLFTATFISTMMLFSPIVWVAWTGFAAIMSIAIWLGALHGSPFRQ